MVALPLAVVATILDTVNEALASASVSPCKTSSVPSVTVSVWLVLTEFVSLSATGVSLTPITVIIKVSVSVLLPSETV